MGEKICHASNHDSPPDRLDRCIAGVPSWETHFRDGTFFPPSWKLRSHRPSPRFQLSPDYHPLAGLACPMHTPGVRGCRSGGIGRHTWLDGSLPHRSIEPCPIAGDEVARDDLGSDGERAAVRAQRGRRNRSAGSTPIIRVVSIPFPPRRGSGSRGSALGCSRAQRPRRRHVDPSESRVTSRAIRCGFESRLRHRM